MEQKLALWRLRSSYLTTVTSISLVLFLLGLLGLLVINTGRISDYVKENIGFTVILKDSLKEVEIRKFQKSLDASPFVKSTEFVTKERAAKELQDDLGEDFVSFLGYNPLLSSIDLKLNANYANVDSIEKLEKSLKAQNGVKEVIYQKSLVHAVNENIKKITMIILLFSVLLFIISWALINNTIRLSIYSKRFLINTMQLIGATESFIRKPFLAKGAVYGSIGAAIAIILLTGIIYIGLGELSEVISLSNILILYFFIIVLGITITTISTYFSLNKYLHAQSDELYY